ncbi:hypothetical protein ACFQ9X_43715 [Catenulispora yoronensis]
MAEVAPADADGHRAREQAAPRSVSAAAAAIPASSSAVAGYA